ncbi:MAG TPA: secondary thiamine-phosphate synthase enzyme YjbQ [Polyangiaceae bacterium]
MCATKTLQVRTKGRGLYDITDSVRAAVAESNVTAGICSVFLAHTSASLVTQENADPAVLRDLERWIDRVAPESDDYEHDAEGPDDMPSHIRASITKTSENVPIAGKKLALGTWQAIYVWEHRSHGHDRRVLVTIIGE